MNDMPMKDEANQLDTLLAQLAEGISTESAPSAVRQRLLAEAELEGLLLHSSLPRPTPRLILAGAFSAILLIGAAGAGTSLLLGRSDLARELSSSLRATLHAHSIGKAPGIAPAAAVALPADPDHGAGDDALSAAFANEDSTTLSADVFALPYSDRAIANGTETTVRVSVPASQLIAWGIPPPANELPANELDDQFPAELLLGDDGLPRAIRILSNSTTSSSAPEEDYR